MTTFESDLAVFGGDIVQVADYAALVESLPKVYTKTALTARQSTTTYADDPELSGIELGVGVWEIELVLFFTVANTTPKLKTRWAFTGTISNKTRLCHGPATDNVDGPESASDTTVRGYAMTTQDASYNASTSTAYSAVLEVVHGVEVTVAGDLSLQWAQVTSTAANVNVQPDSAFRIRKIR